MSACLLFSRLNGRVHLRFSSVLLPSDLTTQVRSARQTAIKRVTVHLTETFLSLAVFNSEVEAVYQTVGYYVWHHEMRRI